MENTMKKMLNKEDMQKNQEKFRMWGEVLDALRADHIEKQQMGLHFMIPSVLLWLLIFGIQFLPVSLYHRNLLVFCTSALLMPMALICAKLLGVVFSNKGNPLNGLGILFTLNQMVYLLIVMWAFSQSPVSMVMLYAIVFAAHLLPFGWLYRSRVYTVFSILEAFAALILGCLFGGAAVAAATAAMQFVLAIGLSGELRTRYSK